MAKPSFLFHKNISLLKISVLRIEKGLNLHSLVAAFLQLSLTSVLEEDERLDAAPFLPWSMV